MSGKVNPLFKGFSKAQPIERGEPLTDGEYEFEVVRTIAKQTQKSGLQFIAEVKILASDNPKHPVGCQRTWMQSMKSTQIASNALRGFTVALAGLSETNDKDKIESEFMPHFEELCSQAVEDNCLAGAKGRVKVQTIQTQPSAQHPNGHPFPRHTFSPAAE